MTTLLDRENPANAPWYAVLEPGQVIRIADTEGCQAVDTYFLNADDTGERYDHQQTVLAQKNIFVTTGTRIMSNEGRVMLTVLDDTVGNHDTLGGACACESNSVRFGLDKRHLHACRENFLQLADELGLGKQDIVPNVNFFMNVPVEKNGHLAIVDGVSKAGSYVDLRAEMRVIVAVSNCPQINNPCNAFNPTPSHVTVWDAGSYPGA